MTDRLTTARHDLAAAMTAMGDAAARAYTLAWAIAEALDTVAEHDAVRGAVAYHYVMDAQYDVRAVVAYLAADRDGCLTERGAYHYAHSAAGSIGDALAEHASHHGGNEVTSLLADALAAIYHLAEVVA